jgi:hypothetical protein
MLRQTFLKQRTVRVPNSTTAQDVCIDASSTTTPTLLAVYVRTSSKRRHVWTTKSMYVDDAACTLMGSILRGARRTSASHAHMVGKLATITIHYERDWLPAKS